MPVIHQMMGQGVAGRAQSDHQHRAAARRLGQRPLDVERIPAGQQRIDLEAPGQFQHIFQDARLGLRDIDRILVGLGVDAGRHAIVADAVAGAGDHRIVDHADGQRRQGQPFSLGLMHLGDALFQRAAGLVGADGVFRERTGLGVGQALRTAVLALVMTEDAVIDLVHRPLEVGAGIGQVESVARA